MCAVAVFDNAVDASHGHGQRHWSGRGRIPARMLSAAPIKSRNPRHAQEMRLAAVTGQEGPVLCLCCDCAVTVL